MSMLWRASLSGRFVAASAAHRLTNLRAFSTREVIAITEVRKGMIIKIEDKYCEVKEWQPHKQGRGAAAYNVTYNELDTGKERLHKFTSASKVPKVDPDREECQVLYTKGSGVEEKIVVLADAEYNELELPLARFVGHSSVPDGSSALLYKDDGEIIKVNVKP
ncbi:efp [Symbiodinium pilosum]|uniref:Efp protein n=1 Tax=Symbiodinium pilosum TaxID=2952 RepID=A0A812U6T1_SYMPI|nr:efp [Symbiodinium pilosum]